MRESFSGGISCCRTVVQLTPNTSRQAPAKKEAVMSSGTASGTAKANNTAENAGTDRIAASSIRRGRNLIMTRPPAIAPAE